MSRLENDTMNSFTNRHCTRFWARYCVWNGSEAELQSLLEQLNAYHLSISFTLEIRGEQIAFLDLWIALPSQKNVLRVLFDVYRKNTLTGT